MTRPNTIRESLPGLWRTFRHFWPYVRKSTPLIAAGSVGLFAETAFRLLEPWPLKLIFDYVLSSSKGHTVSPAFLAGLDPMNLLTVLAIGVVAIISLRALSAYITTISFALVGNRVLTAVRNDVFQHLQRLSLSFHSKARHGDLTIRVVDDISMLKDVAVTAILPMVGSLFIFFGVLGVMFWLNWKLTLVSLAVVPLFWLATTRLSLKIQQVGRTMRKQESDMATTTAESMTAIATVQALSLEDNFSKVFKGKNKQNLTEGVKSKRLEASLERTVDVLFAISTALVLWYGARLVLQSALTPGDLLVFISYSRYAFRPLQDLAKYTSRFAKASAAGERIVDILQRESDIRDSTVALNLNHCAGHVVYDNVSFSYESGRGVLSHVSFEALPGQHVALVGPSGGGKSTILSLLLRLYDPTEGAVMVDGRDIRHYRISSLRSQISTVLQDGLLFAAPLRENISCSKPGATEEDIVEAARLANAHDFIAAMPNGYDTDLGERGITLSVGQRQRIGIARAAMRKTPILILDEPTNSLDEQNQAKVIEAIERLWQGRTTFISTHDLYLAAKANLVLYIDQGGILERGTHQQLVALGARYAAQYRLQSLQKKSINPEENSRVISR